MAKIIRLPGYHHNHCQQLLPWYAARRLDDTERAQVEAHLSSCAECREDLDAELRLKAAYSDLPLELEQGWASMRVRLDPAPVAPAGAGGRGGVPANPSSRLWRRGAPWSGWAVAASLAAVLIVDAWPRPAPHLYHTLATAPSPESQIVVLFRPDTSERTIETLLRSGGLRLADGPTASGAYVLRTPRTQANAALSMLRSRREIVLAEPLSGDISP